MLNPLIDKGIEYWLSMPKEFRGRFALKRIMPDALPWVRIIIYLAWTGDVHAKAAVQRLFVRRGGKYLARGFISTPRARHVTVPVLFESFIGVNGRTF